MVESVTQAPKQVIELFNLSRSAGDAPQRGEGLVLVDAHMQGRRHLRASGSTSMSAAA